MSASRDRKQAARILGITMQAQLRALVEAQGDDNIQMAAIQLGDTFNRNSEFIVWVLKEYGGVEQMPFPRSEPIRRPNLKMVDPVLPADLPDLPEFLIDPKLVN